MTTGDPFDDGTVMVLVVETVTVVMRAVKFTAAKAKITKARTKMITPSSLVLDIQTCFLNGSSLIIYA